jgi:thiamine-phosphate pyrophosphorylase
MSAPHLRRGLYAISQDRADTGALLEWADAVIDGGAVCMQYRDKGSSPSRQLRQSLALAGLCRQRGITFIINDDVELALECDADGVHLGAADGDPAGARTRLGPDRVIGASCYNDTERAREMATLGADYLAFGAFFHSGSKPAAQRAQPSTLEHARALGRPLVAIGGITPDNGDELIRAGADLLAVIGGLAGPPERAFTAARRYTALFDAHPIPSCLKPTFPRHDP